MAHFKRKLQKEREVKIIYNKAIIEDIVCLALQDVVNVELYSKNSYRLLKRDAVKIEFNKEGVVIDIAVKIHYTQSVSDMAFKIQEIIRHDIESMTEYKIASVNVNVKGVVFEEIKKEVPVNNENAIKEEVESSVK